MKYLITYTLSFIFSLIPSRYDILNVEFILSSYLTSIQCIATDPTLYKQTVGVAEKAIDINKGQNDNVYINYLIISAIIVAALCYFVFIRHRKNKKVIDCNQSTFVNTNQEKNVKLIYEKYKSNKVSTDECERLVEKLHKLMNDQRLYTDPELKIRDLAISMNTSAHNLSYLFNQYLNCNYYDFINEYRIEEFKRMIEEEQPDKSTLTSIAMRCGFSSRASFFRYFKRATGVTPNEYVKSNKLSKI